MDKKFLQYKEALVQNLVQEQALQEKLKENDKKKQEILEKILPFIISDTYANDYFMLRKDYDLDYSDVPEIELEGFKKELKTKVDTNAIKRAVKAGLPITNLKIAIKLVCYKKKNNLRDYDQVHV